MPIGFIKDLFQKKNDTELEEIFKSINKNLDELILKLKEMNDIFKNMSERLNKDELIITNFGNEIHRLTWEIIELENRIRRLEEKYGFG
jgi:chromosome segregation ATPase